MFNLDCLSDIIFRSLCGLMVQVRVVPRKTVVGDIDGRLFDNLSGTHRQSYLQSCVFQLKITHAKLQASLQEKKES